MTESQQVQPFLPSHFYQLPTFVVVVVDLAWLSFPVLLLVAARFPPEPHIFTGSSATLVCHPVLWLPPALQPVPRNCCVSLSLCHRPYFSLAQLYLSSLTFVDSSSGSCPSPHLPPILRFPLPSLLPFTMRRCTRSKIPFRPSCLPPIACCKHEMFPCLCRCYFILFLCLYTRPPCGPFCSK